MGDLDLVFTTSIGTPIEPRNLSRHFELLRERAGVRRVRFHDLRYGCASLLFDLGVPLRMVMEILGHSQISTTSDIYTHVMPAQYREVADALERSGTRWGTRQVAAGTTKAPLLWWRRGLWPVQICIARSEGLEPPTF